MPVVLLVFDRMWLWPFAWNMVDLLKWSKHILLGYFCYQEEKNWSDVWRRWWYVVNCIGFVLIVLKYQLFRLLMVLAHTDILAQKNVTVWHSETPNLMSWDSAESMIRTTQNSGIDINESGTGAGITKVRPKTIVLSKLSTYQSCNYP